MFKHEKILSHPVAIERPNPQYAVLLQEQLGGGNGELKAAMQYMSQSFRIKDPEIKDLFLDIAAEELGHMKMVAQTVNLLNGHDVDAEKVVSGEIKSHVILGLNPGLINASGYSKYKIQVQTVILAQQRQHECIFLCQTPVQTLLITARLNLYHLINKILKI